MKPKHVMIKKLFSKEKTGNNKKVDKPWIIQYKWDSEEIFRKLSWFRVYNSDWQDHYDRYINPEHAIRMLEKNQRSWYKDIFEGRQLRLFNKKTHEIINIVADGKKFKIQES